jgi:hypothetical protein
MYMVALVTEAAELDRAAAELVSGDPTSYGVLRVDEGSGSPNSGRDLRMLIERQGYLCRMPTDAEREALEKGAAQIGEPDAAGKADANSDATGRLLTASAYIWP